MLTDLGHVYLCQSELEDAGTILEGAFTRAMENLEETSPLRLKAMHQPAMLRWEQGEMGEAERLFRECLDDFLGFLGSDHVDTIVTTTALGDVLQQAGNLEEAKSLLERSLEWDLEHLGEDHPSTAVVVNNLGLQLGTMDLGEEALGHLEEAMAIAEKVLEPGHWRWPALRSTYGRTLMMVGRYAEAEPVLLASLEEFRAAVGDEDWRTQAVCRSLVELYEATGAPGKAGPYHALLADES
jgi:tetratricopeptide (TPR) repeat protein